MKLQLVQFAALVMIMFTTGARAQERLFPQVTDGCPVCATVARVPLAPAVRAKVDAALRSRQYALAEAPLLTEIHKNPKSPQILALLGNVFFLDGKYINSAVAFKKAEALAPPDNRSRFLLAMCYVIMKHGDWALPELEKLEQVDPHNALYPYWISRVNYYDMHLEDAVANAKRAIQIDPNFMQAYNKLGLYQEGLGKDDEAIKSFKKAIYLNESREIGSPWPVYNLGKLLNTLGRLEEAEAYLKASLKEAPGFPKAYFQLGLVFEKKNQHLRAIQELTLAIANDHSYPEPYYVLGRIYTETHQPEKAQKAFAEFQRLKKHQIGDFSTTKSSPK